MKMGSYYLGLDIGTDSVGYAATDSKYQLKKFHGEPVWGTTIFDQAALNGERRGFRTARRRLERRKQRVELVQEIFAKEVGKVDERFFVRMQASRLFREEAGDPFTLFCDPEFTDKDYYDCYPTIHHLICDLMKDTEPHDVRLLYLACAWLVSHRGHFLSNIKTENLSDLKDFQTTYEALMEYFSANEYEFPWNDIDVSELAVILQQKTGVNNKKRELYRILYEGKKPGKETTEAFPFSRDSIVSLLAGGSCKVSDLYGSEQYADQGSVSLGMDDEKLTAVIDALGENGELISALRAVYDWTVLIDALNGYQTISEAKVSQYDQHKQDLKLLKYLVRKYQKNKYDSVFRSLETADNYVAYSYHTNDGDTSRVKKTNSDSFCSYVKKLFKDVCVDPEDEAAYSEFMTRLECGTFMPKQKNTDNRVIPHQLYEYELIRILDNASQYFEFIDDVDSDGLTAREKILSIFRFRIPYFVGPLNTSSKYSWLKRKQGKIYPWNFESMVDFDESEQQFIKRLTNKCTYCPGEPVLPKDSLAYQKFTVLNEINNLRINGNRISVELKQQIFDDLFMQKKKVTRKKLVEYLICNGVINKNDVELISGIDEEIRSTCSSWIAFRNLMSNGTLTEKDAECIIERASYAEDKSRLRNYLDKQYSQLSEADKKYICGIKIKDFGRLSRRFLCDVEGADRKSGEVFTILSALWNTQDNLMEVLSSEYTFREEIDKATQDYYAENPRTLSERLDEMYVSNAVKRPIYRTLAIVKDVVKALGVPEKIFVETTRGGSPDQKGKRTLSRKQQILDLYKYCKEEDVRLLKQQLEALGDAADNKLQGDKLFLYYMQLGRCMYSGETIDITRLGSKLYDIDHIYPQAFVKDDSIINNKVLVLSSENGEKSDHYPIASAVRQKMSSFWLLLKEHGLVSDEKYKRLVRNTPFSEEEKLGFINRQLTETSQATKAVATVLKEKYPDTEIVYCKARLVSDFRQEFEIPKCRSYNDLHHAVDAYLNIVTGNVYNMKFSKQWFRVDSNYSIKTKTLFTRPLICNGQTVWDGESMLASVKKTAVKNTAHFTKYAYFKKGGLFDQMPVPAGEKLIPLKAGLPTDRYGGYNKAGVMFFVPVKYTAGKKKEILIMSVEMLHGEKFLKDPLFAETYSYMRLQHILGKKIDYIEFPMGIKPWKVNTVVALDGFEICIAGIGSGGKCLVAQPVMQFSADPYWCAYLKRLERFTEKSNSNSRYVFDEEYDKISRSENLALYDLYIEKYERSVYGKRVNSPLETLKEGRTKFTKLEIKEQAQALLNVHATFGRVSGGCDLRLIGGKEKAAATVNFSSTVANWKKKYANAIVIDRSVSGLWEKASMNLLEL